MAVTKSKRSVRKKQSALGNPFRRAVGQQSAKSKNTKPRTQNRSASFVLPKSRRTFFPQTNGRVVKQVEFFTDQSNNTLELTFQDDTSLSFEFEPSFVWEAYFARWKSGEQRILHRWPPIRSQT